MKINELKFQNTSLLILRLLIAAIFLFSTYAKWQYLAVGAPGSTPGMVNLTWFLMIVEPLGAVGLIFGLLTRWAAAGLAIIMAGAVVLLKVMFKTNVFTATQAPGLDYNLLILAGCIILIAFGAGKFSLGSSRRKKR